jgi:hypothetical protein
LPPFNFEEFGGIIIEEGIGANVDVWLSNKSKLFNLLRKHPNWEEDAKAIILRNKEYRQVNVDDRIDWMGELVLMHPFDSLATEALALCRESGKFVTEIEANCLTKYGYDYETDSLTHMPNVRAYDKNGIACKFDENQIF